jgi:sugar phosphate isomerase/epimerase
MREKIGINADSFTINGDLKILEGFLRTFAEAGFAYVEIPVHGLDVIVNGSLSPRRLAETKSMLARYPFSYTVHSPDRLDLADATYPAIHAATLKSTIDFAAEIGAKLVVYHGSLCKSGNEETERLGKIAEHASRRGVTVAVENIFRQHAQEVSYRFDPRNLAAQIATINSPALGICFDFGHAFISSNEEGFPYMDAFNAVLPRLAHVHIHDNFGKPAVPGTRPIDAMFLGIGDLHLVPGDGAIPYDTLFPLFSPAYKGVYMMEIHPRFGTEYRRAIAWIEKMIVRKENGA